MVATPTPNDQVVVVALHIADDPASWEEIGFTVTDRVCRLAQLELRFDGEEGRRGLAGWTLACARSTELDGLMTFLDVSPRHRAEPPPTHLNGATALDHVVAFSPSFDRTVATLEQAGLSARRFAEIGVNYAPVRRAFYRLGEVIFELVDQPDGEAGGQAFFWGIAVTVADVEALAEGLGERTSGVRDAVQRGRRIAPLRRSAGLSLPVAFMSPPPSRAADAA